MTLEEFLPSSFNIKSNQDNVLASCFKVDKEETVKAPSTGKEGTSSESSPKVSPSDEKKSNKGNISNYVSFIF